MTIFPYFMYVLKMPLEAIQQLRGQEDGGGGTVYLNGFYADIWSQPQVQEYKSFLKSFLYNSWAKPEIYCYDRVD